ncbi:MULTISPECIES: site-specific integrase [unclassified Acinetobacter]|uniref:tyrosine-type recombinase/integrase n=1 Tax=unclassified Acinetobacter TaxID=196816 RepID=UPI0015D0FEDF|nr:MULTISPECIES: site-specific integrase [unclassified Acinetobacter]
MQKPIQRGNSWRMTVRYNGKRYTATRDTKQECIAWANAKLLDLKLKESLPEPQIDLTFKKLFEKYYADVGSKMRGYTFILQQLKTFDKYWGNLAYESIHSITSQHITKWRNERLNSVGAGTVHRQMCLYSSVFTYAKNELFLIKDNPFIGVTKPQKPKPRSKLITDAEIHVILEGLNYVKGTVPTKPSHFVAWSFLFAIETAMRKGEIINITRSNIHDDYIHLPITKNGSSRDVPLTNNAKALLALLPKNSEKIIPQNENSFRLIWQRNLHRVGLNGVIHFHDTRHEAITRFANQRKLTVEMLAKLTGHKTINTLINTYYNPSASDIANILNS